MQKDPSDNSLVKIGQASKVLGVSIDTLRRWEKKGSISPIYTPGGTRLYSLQRLEQVKLDNLNKSTNPTTSHDSSEDLNEDQPIISLFKTPVKYLGSESKSRQTYLNLLKTLIVLVVTGTILTGLITGGYLFAPQKTKTLLGLNQSQTQPSSQEGQVLGITSEATNLLQTVTSFILSPFNSLAQKTIQTTAPERAEELGFPSSDIQLSLNQQDLKIQDLENSIENISQKITQNNLEIGDFNQSLLGQIDTSSLNLVPNSSFEANDNGLPNRWIYVGNATSSNTFVTTEISRSGYNSLKFKGGTEHLGILNPDNVAGESRPYHLSFYLKSYQTGSFDMDISFWDPVNKKRVGIVTKRISESDLANSNSGWQLIEFDMNSPGPGSGKNWFPVIELPNLKSGVIYLDDIAVTEVGQSGFAQVRPNGAISSIGDGSVLVTAGGEIKPYLTRVGSLGTTDLRFQSLYLSNASIDKDGNASFAGNLTISGTSTLNGNTSALNLGGNINPAADNTYDIGTSSYRWKTGYLGTSLIVGTSTTLSPSSLVFQGAGTVTGTTTLDLNSTGSNAITLDSTTTGAVNIGTGSSSKTINVGTGAGGNTINIGTNNTAGDTIAIGSALDTTSITGANWSITSGGTGSFNGSLTLGDATSDDIAITGRVTTSIVPKTTANVDLGTSSLKWNNIYVNTINATGTNTSGQAAFTYDPADTTLAESSVFINPTTAATNESLFTVAIAGVGKANIDIEGDLVVGYSSATAPLVSNPFNVYNHGTTQVATIDTSGNLSLTSSNVSGTTTSSSLSVTANSLTTGTGEYLTSTSITTGKLLDITTGAGNTWLGNGTTNGLVDIASSSTAGTGSSSSMLLNLSRSGANSNTAHTAYGIYSNVTNTNATSGTNIAAYLSASGATTANYGLIVASGNVGIGDTTPTSPLTMESTTTDTSSTNYGIDIQRNVNPTSSGTVQPFGLIMNTDLNTNVNLTSNADLGLAGAEFQTRNMGTGTVNMLQSLIGSGYNNSTGTVTTNRAITARLSNWDASGTTTDAIGLYSYVEALVGTMTNRYGIYVADAAGRNGNGGTLTTNYGLYLADQTRGTTDYAIYSAGGQSYHAGNFGIGDTTPSAALEVGNGTDSLQVSSVGDLTFVDADGAASITGPAGGALTAAAGAAQALTLTANNSSTWSTSDGLLTVTGDDGVTLNASSTAGITGNVPDNITNAIDLQQGSDNYFNVNTTNSSENVAFGNATTNPSFSFLGTGAVTVAGSEGANSLVLTAGDAVISDGSFSITDDDNATSFSLTNNTATTVGAGVNTDGLMDISSTTLTTGNLVNLETTTALTSGRMLNITSTSTALTSGNLIRLDWTPGSATTATGDLFSLNIGTNGTTTGSLFNILDTGSSIFSVSETSVTTSLPTNFTAAGDVNIAYDINFTNPTASYIKSSAPLYLQAGPVYGNNDLTLQTFGTGAVNISQSVATTGSPTAFNVLGGAHTTLTASTEATDVKVNLARTVQFATGALTNQRAFQIQAPTYGFVGASTVTNAATLYIDRAPQAGTNATLTNAYAFWVDAGVSAFGGNVVPDTSDGAALGTTSLMWSDLFLASGSVVNFNNGDVTLTHTANTLTFDGGSTVFNEAAGDFDFKIEADANANMFTLDAGLFTGVGQLSIGSAAQGTPTAFTVIDNPAISATANQNFYKLLVDNSAAVTVPAGTAPLVASLAIEEPNITATGTVTTATTLYIKDAPTEGTSNYALFVDAGTSRFDGAVSFGAQSTFTESDATPDVSAGSFFISHATGVTITDFDAGAGTLATGQIIYVESGGATVYDVTTSGLSGGVADITTAAGDLTAWIYDGTDWKLINWVEQVDTQTGADLAEWYVSSEDLEPGDVVSINPDDNVVVHKSQVSSDSRLMGIVSTNPGIILGPKEQHTFPIALAGRVPTKVSTENGPIERGDYLTSSSTPGVAMKATKPGPVIGKALESFGNTSEVEFGKIMAFVNVSFADPGNFLASLSLDEEGNLIAPKIKTGSLVISTDIDISRNDSKGLLAYTQSTNTANQPTYEVDVISSLKNLEEAIIETQNNNASAAAKLADLQSKTATDSAALADLKSQIATLAGQVATDSASENIGLNLTPPELLFATGSATLADLKVTSQATFSGILASYDLNVSNIFKSLGETVLGNTTIAGDVSVDGTFSISNGNTINSIGTLYLQSSMLASNIDLFNGLVTIDNEGKLTAQTLSARQYQAVAGASVGTSIIKAETSTIDIPTAGVSSKSRIFITPTSKTSSVLSASGVISGNKFTVSIPNITPTDIAFNWWIVNEVDE